jgi:uncharacterized RDD family membrane protein YckC
LGIQTPQSTIDSSAIGIASSPNVIAGFWRRFFAFAVDAILLGIVGLIMGIPLYDSFVRMGPWGKLVGFCIALCYFGIFDSSIGGGQTIGKRILGVKVVDVEGTLLPIETAILRYFVYAVPYFLNGLLLPVSLTPLAASAFLLFLVSTVGGTNAYLLIFNRATRQGLHDLSVGSYVSLAEASGPILPKPIWRGHWAMVATILLLCAGLSCFVAARLMHMGPFPRLLEDASLIEQINGVQQAGIYETTVYQGIGGTSKTLKMQINIRWDGDHADEDAVAQQVAKSILQHDPTARNFDTLQITFIRGYDIGIASAQSSENISHTIAWWSDNVQ